MIYSRDIEARREKVQNAADRLVEICGYRPQVALLLGTGHSELARRLEDAKSFSADEIPDYPKTDEETSVVVGKLEGYPVLVSDAPLAPYLGTSGEVIAFPVRMFRAMGAKTIVLTAAAAALHSSAQLGDLGLISDHLDFTHVNPLLGPNDTMLGPRFPDMTEPYDPELGTLVRRIAAEVDFPLREGVFAAVQGPSLPTRAEYRFLRNAGADYVGMSTVPEVLAAVHAGLRVLALVGITQIIDPMQPRPIDLESMVDAADLAAPRMASLLVGLLEQMAKG
ncbi:MAG: purine-nucleoside phosphorylase [Planctomycetota bacterium]|nr:MAG: purine-nucleoside phosphorylase [Planctomycetota bacterium]